eukprot:1137081-Pyramimonas_sp.AAC.1
MAATVGDAALRLQAVATCILHRSFHHVRRLTGVSGSARRRYVKRDMGQMLHGATRDDGKLRHCCRLGAGGSARRRGRANDDASRRA